MKLVWHIVVKDLWRMWIPLVLWAVVLATKIEMGVDLLHGDAADLAHFDLMRVAIGVFVGVDVFVNLILVALLVQDDALVGTTMFWVTRPISGRRLLAAKLLGCFLMFGVIPILVSLRWWLACGYGPAEMARSAVSILDTQALIVGIGLLVAVNTRTMNGFLLGLLATAVGFYVWWFMLVRVLGTPRTTPGADVTRIAVLASVAMVGGALMVGQQFLVRHARRALVTLGGAGIAATFIGLWWPWDWSPPRTSHTPGLSRIAVAETSAESFSNGSLSTLYVTYEFTQLPKELGLRGRAIQSWDLRSGRTTVSSDLMPVTSLWATWLALGMPPDQFTGPVHRSPYVVSRGEDDTHRSRLREAEAQSHAVVRRDELERIQEEPGPFSAHLSLELDRARRVLEFVPRQDEVVRAAGWSVRVAFAEWRDGLLFLRLVESQPLQDSNFQHRIGLSSFFHRPVPTTQYTYYRVNRARGATHEIGQQYGFQVAVAGQAVRWLNLTLDSRTDMEGAKVAIISYERAGLLELDVNASQLVPQPLQ